MIEVPDMQVILGMIVAFFVGLGGLYLIFKLQSLLKTRSIDEMYTTKLEYYEKQLIDIKIRLDTLEIQDIVKDESGIDKQPEPQPSISNGNAVEQVLHLITQHAMTSRDIQITLKRSREHTSRLMKKLFEEGYVKRTQTKPYKYEITEKGKEKVSIN